MLEHHIQKQIVYELAFSEGLRFSELQPEGVDNKLFDYHLKAVLREKLVSKGEDGLYRLTPEGRRLGSRIFLKQLSSANLAHSALFLLIRRKTDAAWLLYKRATHPLLGKIGFMHADPEPNYSAVEAAQKQCLEKTGLKCDFKVLGSGYFRTFQDEEMEGFVNFTLLACEDAEGEIAVNDEMAEYYWDQNPDFSSPDMIPNMPLLVEAYEKGQPFFLDQKLQLS